MTYKTTILRWLGRRTKILVPTVIGMISVLAFYGAYLSRPAAIEQLGNLLFDRYQAWQPRVYHEDVPVRIIDVDDESLKRIGQWPWPRTTIARLHDRLGEAGAAVISYDIIFSEPDRTSPARLLETLETENLQVRSVLSALPDNDRVFAQALSRTQTVLGFFLVRYETLTAPQSVKGFAFGGRSPDSVEAFAGTIPALPQLGANAAGEAFVSFSPSGDGIVREAPMIYRVGDRFFPALSIESLRAVQGAGAFKVKTTAGSGEAFGANALYTEVASIQVGDFEFPTTESGGFRVYYTPTGQIENRKRIIPAWKILDDSVPISEWADRVAGNIVFIGTGAEGLKDIVATPANAREPGVVVHAQVVEQIIGEALHGGQLLKRPYEIGVLERWLILLPGFLLILVLPRINSGWGALLSASLIGAIGFYSWQSFAGSQTLINPIYPVLAILTTYLLMTVASFYLTETERSRIRSAFSMYLSPEMVRQVSEDPALLKLGGEEREMTILFLDIRSFSKISEALEPQEITTFLNIFLTPMTDTLQGWKSTIDKYIGDAIVAFWNAPLDDPDHEKNAARAVLEMNEILRGLNIKYADDEKVKWPGEVAMGIGLNTGVCCVGNLGSEQRFSYSMIGDAANLAARIEGLTKQYGVGVLVGDSTKNGLEGFALLEADLLKVVGREKPERIWILMGDEGTVKSPDWHTLAKEHAMFLEAYRNQEWDVAEAASKRAESLAPELRYYQIMRARIPDYKANPPGAEWDGVYIATSK